MLPKVAVCAKQEGECWHKGPCEKTEESKAGIWRPRARRLRAGRSCHKQPHAVRLPKSNSAERQLCVRQRKRMLKVAKRGKREGPRAKGKRPCEEIAKGEWNAPRAWPCARRDEAMAATRDPV